MAVLIRQIVTLSVGGSHGIGYLVKLHRYRPPLNFKRAQLTNNRIKYGISAGVLQVVTCLEHIL
jgi:hypothetical protein